MLRGRLPVILLLGLFAGHPVAGLVCEATCGTPGTHTQPAVQNAGCHAAATADPAPPVRVSAADAERCDHGSVREALTGDRWQASSPRGQASGATETIPSLLRQDSRALHGGASRYSPPGPRVGFGLAIRV
jgi:hypothetical protein